MSFTEDELQSFNTILERRLQAQQRDMERVLDRRMNEYRRELDQRLGTVHVDVQRAVSQKLTDFQVRLESMLSEKLNTQPARLIQALNREIEQRQKQIEGNIDRMLAAQLLGIEHLEQIVESMQVVMTSNHALLSNRLYHHQQLPFERAHNVNEHARPLSNSVNKSVTITEERVTNGVEAGGATGPAQTEEE